MNRKRKMGNVIAIAICLVVSATSVFAQDRAVRIVKDGIDIFTYELTGREKIVFQDPAGPTTSATDDTLIIMKANGESTRMALDDIQEITLEDGLLSVVPYSGTPAVYAISNVTLFFQYGTIGIKQAAENAVNVWLNSPGEIAVECATDICSLTLFSVDGKVIASEEYSNSNCGSNSGYTSSGDNNISVTSFGDRVSGLPTGVYLVRVETSQNAVFKKIIINH